MRHSFVLAALACGAMAVQASCATGAGGNGEVGSGAGDPGADDPGSSGNGGAGVAVTSSSGGDDTLSSGATTGGSGNGNGNGNGSGGAGGAGGAGSGASSGATSGATSGAGGGGPGPGAMNGSTLFEAPNPWNTPVDGLPKSASSNAITSWLAQNGGWGTGQMRIDFSIEVLTADAATPFKSFNPTSDFYTPDCDHVPFPVPAGGALEGEQGYECTSDGDCHLIVVHPQSKKLYEMWRANIVGNSFDGGCAAVWDLAKAYPENLRGEGCTSADAGGFPIAAMLFSADEVFAGEIPHAIRFILPNSRIRDGVYVHPGTHGTSATSGGPNAPPYGVHFRLRADFPLASLPSDGARVVAKAMQKYGMFLADGGTIALTAQSDRFTQHSWADVDVDTYSLSQIKPTDMEVVDLGNTYSINGSCVRNP